MAPQGRPWLGWLVVLLLAGGVAASFAFASGPEAPEKKAGGPRATPVAVTALVRGDIAERGRFPGELVADAADIAAYYAGRVEAVEVRVGDRVAAGDVLARLDPVDLEEQLAEARAQVTAAEAGQRRTQVELNLARKDFERSEDLHTRKIIATRELEVKRAAVEAQRAGVGSGAAQAAQAQARVALLEKRLTESTVLAPFAGRIADRYVDPGATVSGGARLLRLVAEAPLRIRFDVPEHEVGALSVGSVLTVTTRGHDVTASAESAVTATVAGLSAEVSRDRRVAIAEAVIDKPPADWLPGMYAEANVTIQALDGAFIVPDAAVLSRLMPDGRLETGLFIAKDDVARWVDVKVLVREGDRVGVAATKAEAALVEGTQVLTAGHVDLTDGSAIKVAKVPAAGTP